MTTGTPESPLRVAIVGAGPSGFYAAEYLLKQAEPTVEIDLYDKLPTPFGLVRGGVAPDHLKIKTVTKVYDKIASNPRFRFFGNVAIGRDLSHDDLTQHYHAIIYTYGAASDKKLGVPGEDLPGSHAATDFVGWYNAHPEYCGLSFDLGVEAAAVIGIGNVAMDVTRILARSQAELMATDIADYAMEALKDSNIKTIYVFGRRGPAQAAFTNPEIKELGEMEEADLVVLPDEAALDPLSQAFLESGQAETKDIKNVEILRKYAGQALAGKPKQIVMRFLTSPVELIGTDRVEAIRIVKNELVADDRGNLRPRATDQFETIPVGLVFRSVGYFGQPLPGVPFYERWGTIPNDHGRVLTEFGGSETVPGEYVAGWIKRGPSGIIGTNKPDAIESAKLLLEDMVAGKLIDAPEPNGAAVENLLRERGIRYVNYADWLALDALEIARGEAIGRPRLKFATIEEMLAALGK
jgi:ferredoxin/flavodoxin---NADP+ reductase